MKSKIIGLLCSFLLFNVSVSANEGSENYGNENKKSSSKSSTMCPALNYKNRFSRNMIGEVDVFGGYYLGEYTKSSWNAGARGFFHFDHMFSLGVEYLYANINADSQSSFGRVLKNRNQNIVDGQFNYNIELLSAFGNTQVPMSLQLAVGAGSIQINDNWNWLVVIGGGMKIYLVPEWLAIRIDVNTYMHPVPTNNGSKFSSDLAVMAGLAFHFPYKPA